MSASQEKKYTAEELKELWNDYMIDGARYGDVDDIKEALAHDADVNAGDAEGRTALHMAAANGHLDVVNLLLNAGANTEQCNVSGNTALHWACVGGHPEMVRLLLQHGANPSAINKADRTPLDGALDNEGILIAFQQHRSQKDSIVDDEKHASDEEEGVISDGCKDDQAQADPHSCSNDALATKLADASL